MDKPDKTNKIINELFKKKNRSIPSENKGFKMLSKLGWSEGQALGRNNDGLLEPVSKSQANHIYR